MLEHGKISIRQFKLLVTIFTIGSSILVVPSGLAAEAKQDAWIAAIVGLLLSMPLIYLYNALGCRFPKLTLAEYSEQILGKWVGKLVSLLFMGYFFLVTALLLREIGDFMTTQIYPETPIAFIEILFLAVVIMAVRYGLEPLTRACEIFLPWILLLCVVLFVFLSPNMKFHNMQPVLEDGIKPLLRAVYSLMGLPFLELAVFLMIVPYVNRPSAVKKAFYGGTLAGGIVIVLITLLSILVIGADLTHRQLYPSYALAQTINVGGFFQRVEAMMAAIWLLTIFFKLTVCFYASLLGFAQTLRLKDYRFLTLPFGMLTLVLSIAAIPSTTYFNNFVARMWTPFSLTFGLFLPLVLLGVHSLQKNFKRSS